MVKQFRYCLTHWPLGDVAVFLNKWVSNTLWQVISGKVYVKLPSANCQLALLMISQHWFRQRLGAIRQQAITWANVYTDLSCYMASLGCSEWAHWLLGDLNEIIVSFKLILVIYDWTIFCKLVLRWMSLDPMHEKSALVQVTAWCSAGDKPLPGPMLTKIIVTIWQLYASISWLLQSIWNHARFL